MRRIAATRTIAESPPAVFDFIAELDNHWRLASRFVGVTAIDPAGPDDGRIVIRAPLGIRRAARTRIVSATAPGDGGDGALEGLAELDGGTVARIEWRLAPAGRGTRVTLGAHVVRASRRDGMLLAIGGRPWLRRLLRHTLGKLAEELASQRR